MPDRKRVLETEPPRELSSPEVARAIERVRAEVFRMDQSADIAKVVHVIWDELRDLGYPIDRVSIAIIDEEKDFFGSYQVGAIDAGIWPKDNPRFQRLSEHLYMGFQESAPSVVGGPYRQELIEAWRRGETFTYQVVSRKDKERLRRLFARQGVEISADRIQDFLAFYVPFQFGVIGLFTGAPDPAPWSEEDVRLLTRLGEAFAEGYQRFLTMRDKEIQRAVDHLRAEVGSMRQSSDVVPMVEELATQLMQLGMEFDYCSISVIDEEDELVRIYGLARQGFPQLAWIPKHSRSTLEDLSEHREAVMVDGLVPGFDLFYTTEPPSLSPVLAERGTPPRLERRSDEDVTRLMKRWGHRWWAGAARTADVPRSAIRVPFSQGTIAVVRMPAGAFTLRDVDLVAAFAEALSLGFIRFLDFQRLERRNRELEIERSVAKVQTAVQAMHTSSDLVGIISHIDQELKSLRLDFVSCSMILKDAASGRVRIYATVPAEAGAVLTLKPIPLKGDTIERLESEDEPIVLSEIPEAKDTWVVSLAAAPDSYYGRLSEIPETGITHRSDEELARAIPIWKKFWQQPSWPKELLYRSNLRCRFPGGTISLSHNRAKHFGAMEARVLERFAEAFSLGYTRHLDFRRLEEQKRELAIESALERIQNAVQAMNTSADIVRVITLLSDELDKIGLVFTSCAISLEDETKKRFSSYSTLPLDMNQSAAGAPLLPFGPDTIERLDREEGPIGITDIPEARDRIVLWLSIPYRDYYQRQPKTTETIILSRSEEEMRKLIPLYEKAWKLSPWPKEYYLRSSVRSPFKGGILAVQHTRANHFTSRDAQILERFAKSFSLGYARYLDFRKLEEQNRELEIERALESIQNAVQAMKSSADIVPVMTRLSQELVKAGLDFDSCAIAVVDERIDQVLSLGTMPQPREVSLEKLLESAAEPLPFGADTMERIERESGPFTISQIPGAEGHVVSCVKTSLSDYYRRQPKNETTVILSRSEEELEKLIPQWERIWKVVPWPEIFHQRSSLRAPFGGGYLALNDHHPHQFTQGDARILDRFAEAFALGYTRHLDFRRLEEQNRELEIERSVESVQIAVQAMKSSADIVRVCQLLSQELEGLGVAFDNCIISLIDEKAGRVQSYNLVRGDFVPELTKNVRVVSFGPDTIERVRYEDGATAITDIPGARDRLVLLVGTTVEDYYSRQPRELETVIQNISMEEVQRRIPQWERIYNLSPWPRDFYLRSTVRAPFQGGALVIADTEPEHYSARESRILERFAEACSLGYARHLDFRQLEEQNKVLEAANRLKSEFLANMSHEIRTPMNAVINFSSLILDGTYGEISEDLRDAVEEIDRNGEALLALINDVLDLAKIDAGAMKLQLAKCEPGACLDNAMATLHYQAQEKGLSLTREVEDPLPEIEADERRITQHVVLNLVKNAIKFTTEGGIRVGAKARDGEILFWVADTGMGIPQPEQRHIFESFRQVDGSITREQEGSGLGLTIARKFVEMHDGRIWVESKLGEGSTFYFTLPFEKEGA